MSNNYYSEDSRYNQAQGYIVVLKIHKAPWATAEERRLKVEVLRGTCLGCGPCIFWSEEQARETLKKVRSDLLQAHQNKNLLTEKDVQDMCEIRLISWKVLSRDL